ncbi:MAG: enoyl-CoA hydratase/isomerase family protein [Alphaproteobacteria bacterium]|nr:enoyl-CoA hydratase/isomerase family protein [Alphaproteobacteria bacterium]
MSDAVRVEMQGDIALLIFNRPASLNALNTPLARGIAETLVELDADPSVKGIVLTGAGDRAFCAGADLVEARGVQVHQIEEWFGTVCNVYRQIVMTEKPVIAALNGIASGGGFQIALVSDLRVGHPGTRLGQPEVNAGIPSVMGSYWISLNLPWSLNQELSMTGRMMEADEAQRFGLLNRVVAREQVIPTACELAELLAGKLPTAFARTKKRFREVALRGFEEAFRAGVLGQQEAFARGEPQRFIDDFLAKKKG